MKLGQFIKGCRVAKSRPGSKFTQADLAKTVGVSPARITQLENSDEDTPSIEAQTLMGLARAFKCTAEELMRRDSRVIERLLPGSIGEPAGEYNVDEIESLFVDIPLYEEIALSAGNGSNPSVEQSNKSLHFLKESLRDQGVSEGSAACCKIRGDSMEPVLPEGSTVGIDTTDTEIRDGSIYAIEWAGQLYVKRLYRIPYGVRIRSYNADYPDEVLTGDSLNEMRIIGRVFWSGRYHI